MRRILGRLTEPLVALLLVAGAIAGAVGDAPSAAVIAVVVVLSIGLETWQERRAEAAADALKRSVAIHASVLRDGALTELPVDRLVPGDVVELRAGDLVAADGLVIVSEGLRADEAVLTGEPYPVEKRPGPSGAATFAEAYDALFAGAGIVSGSGRMLVLATGRNTAFGGVAAALSTDEPPTAFERGLHELGGLIMRLTLFLSLFVVLGQLAFHRPPLEAFLFALALAVGMTPELLPMVRTVTLARGGVRMAARRVVAKKLSAIHDLGAMTVLCTDKTGTLTEARIVLTGCVDPAGGDSARVAALAATNSRLASGVRSPLDAAILAAAGAAGDGWRLVAEAPFDFERRRASVLVDRDGERLIVVKGAPEAVIAASCVVESAAGPALLTDEARRRLLAFLDERASSGLRSLAVAVRSVSSEATAIGSADERDLVLAGFCFFADPVKASAPAALARLTALGVRVKILSGDAPAVVAHVAASLGLDAASVLTGDDIARLSDAALSVRARQTDLFGRLAPDQKVRVVRALKARGETVGFLGDGLNDAPAIKAADAGLSVVDATDVARAAADLILMEQDLGVLADGVAEGRRSHANILKYVRMATSSNFGNMASMAIASVALPFLPLTPIQVLLNNLLYDVSEAGIPFDDVDEEQVLKPHGWDMRGIRRFTFVMGPLSSVFDLAAFSVLRLVFDLSGAAFQTAWFLESMTTQILVVFVIRTAEPVWSSRPNGLLAVASLGALATAYLLALTPAGAAFGFVAPPAPALLAMLAISAAYLLAAEAMKSFASRPRAARSRRR